MLITKSNPKGLDLRVQNLQNLLHTHVLKAWGLEGTPDLYQCYGRVYRNRKDQGYVAEVYDGSGEYKEVHHDDRLAALSFVGFSENFEDEKGVAHLVFFIDLNKIKTGLTDRPDEQARIDIIKFAQKGYQGFEFETLETGAENVLREYPGTLSNLRINAGADSYKIDMHPYHCFRINLNLLYSIYSTP